MKFLERLAKIPRQYVYLGLFIVVLVPLVLNLGILCGSLFGPALAAQIGDLREVLFISAGLRFLAGFFFMLWG